ncbi:HAD family hydrolase [Parazoarcus communis]|uniref:HAD family hydrolase n=1 Tax=Parazoarcus communis TaxID=41977 RepID=A0A2U8GMS2_9RHOO|nr:HAD-IA family hydrolase [Parazoarcus communis]AWI74493.1 HAD family hydrolase [Parazoarcus communis]
MAERFDLVVFDWDGTVLDSASAIVQSIVAACRDLGLPEPTEERARYVIGLGLGDALRHAVPELAEEQYPRMVERYRHHYLTADQELTLFPGVAGTIEWLVGQGRYLAVATGKSRNGLNRALAHSGLGKFFHSTRCADECFSKPHPAMLEQLMEELGVGPERTLMIGDTTHDLQMAKNAGVAGLAVSFGAHPVEALRAESPLACVDTPRELDAWLRKNI